MSIELKQAAQQALLALENSQPHPSNPVIGLTNQDFINHEETIRQLRTAIQQAEAQQPATATACGIPGMAKTTCPYCEQGFAFEHEQPDTGEPVAWNSIQIASWIGSQLMHQPSMFERATVCKFVRSLGRHPTLLRHSPKIHPAPSDDVVLDAARYRWLRDHDHWPAPFSSSQEPEPVRGRDLDSNIDAAMLAAK